MKFLIILILEFVFNNFYINFTIPIVVKVIGIMLEMLIMFFLIKFPVRNNKYEPQL